MAQKDPCAILFRPDESSYLERREKFARKYTHELPFSIALIMFFLPGNKFLIVLILPYHL